MTDSEFSFPESFDSHFIFHTHEGFCGRAYEAYLASLNPRSNSINEIIHCVTDSIIYSCMFAEAGINAVFDHYLYPKSSTEQTNYPTRLFRRICGVKSGKLIESIDVFEKMDILLAFIDSPSMPKGENPYQNMKLLVELRNAIIHSRPEGEIHLASGKSSELGKLKRLEGKLEGKFKFNSFANEEASIVPPMFRIATPECALWAVDTATNFWNFLAVKINPSNDFAHPCREYKPKDEYEKALAEAAEWDEIETYMRENPEDFK